MPPHPAFRLDSHHAEEVFLAGTAGFEAVPDSEIRPYTIGSLANAKEYMSTLAPPADCPNIIILFGSPPNCAMLGIHEQ